MFYKSNFGKSGGFNKPVKMLQQTKVPQKMTQQARQLIHQKIEQQKQLKLQQLGSNVSSTKYNKFYINLQPIIDQANLQTAWISPALIPIPNQRARNLYFKKQSYLITNYYGSDYPRSFWICALGVNGYLDSTGATTNRVCNMNLTQISANVDDSGQKFVDLLYAQQDEVTWPLPANGVPISFQIMLDTNQFLNMPLPNPIAVNFQIRQIGI